MNKIYELQEIVTQYISEKLSKNYNFDLWKETLVLEQNNQQENMLKKWSFFYKTFYPQYITVGVQASEDKWCPCIMAEFQWNLETAAIKFRIILIKNEVLSVQVIDMFDVSKIFGDNFDFKNKFNSEVILMDALSGKY
jgi:hypothetical protein